MLALTSLNSVWSWGLNSSGELGNNTTANKSSPVIVVGAHSFVEISAGYYFSLALKANGEVWSWGLNSSGQLGDNTTASKSSPVLVVGAHSFVEISGGSGLNYSLARKANGEVWSWGHNLYGQLGDNTTANKSSPVLVFGSHVGVSLDFFELIKYRHGATPEVCVAAEWNVYRQPFTSLGFVQVKTEVI